VHDVAEQPRGTEAITTATSTDRTLSSQKKRPVR